MSVLRTDRHRRFAMLLITGLAFWLALASWGLSSPTGSSPDDDFHLANIYCAAGDAECTVEGDRLYPCYAWNPKVTGDCRPVEAMLATPGAIKAIDPMGPMTLPVTSGIADDRPTFYYWTVGFLTGDTLAETSATIRLFNSALAVLMAFGSLALTRRRLRPAVAMSWLVAAVPLSSFMIASVNLSSWSIIGIGAMWGPLLSFLGERRFDRRSVARIVFVGWAVLMALGARNDSSIYVVIVLVALLPLVLRRGMDRWRMVVPVLIAGAAAVAFVAVNLVRATWLATTTSGAPNDPFFLLTDTITRVVAVVAAPALGWMDTPMPTLVTALSSAVAGAAVVIGAGVRYRRKTLSAALIVLLTWGSLVILWPRTNVGVQPRYFLPVVMVFLGLMLLPRPRGRIRLISGTQAAVMFGALAVANSLALLTNLWRYIAGLTGEPFGPADLLRAEPDWWWQSLPVSPFGIWFLGTVTLTAALALTWRILYRPRARTTASSLVTTIELKDSQAPRRLPESARGPGTVGLGTRQAL